MTLLPDPFEPAPTAFIPDAESEGHPPPAQRVERRQSRVDRRSNARQGKFDRRRNRCGQCINFEARPRLASPAETGTAPDGFCQKHQEPIASQTYACWVFEPLPT